jgi:hypothetical protein
MRRSITPPLDLMEVDMEGEPRANTPPLNPKGFAAGAGAAEALKRKKKKETWQRSEAKCLLRKDIISGAVPDTMVARDVYLMHDGLTRTSPQT